ncbi:MAG: hypothetical protein OHK0046_06520 [Anaerolineae bacterium]
MRRRLIVLLLLLITSSAFAQSDVVTPVIVERPDEATYVVQRGDTLGKIARQFNTTVSALAAENGITNPSLILVGQVLRVPSGTVVPSITPTAQPPTATTAPSGSTYTVKRGESLYRIAARFDTTVTALVELNNIANPNIIFTGQVLRLPGTVIPPSDAEGAQVPVPPIEVAFGYALIVYFDEQDSSSLIEHLQELDMAWVKVRADWRTLETTQGQPDYEALDALVALLNENGFSILIMVTNAPDWARETQEENGPPTNLINYSTFVNALAERYKGVVDAYQIWDEPNLRRNWNCNRRLCDTDYMEMLRLAHRAVKIADESAVVVSAGLAPTRFNDRVNAIDDRLYLSTLYANGLTNASDAVGVHPAGFANPPDARCCEPSPGVESHYEDSSFYFLETLSMYREIMVANGDSQTPLWITRFGWGTSEDTDPPGEINLYVRYTDLAEQAVYVARAFEIGESLDYVGPMFLDNLNGCQGMPNRAEACYPSLLNPDGMARPVYEAIINR